MKSGGVNVWLATPSQSVRIRGHDSRQSDSEWIKGNGRILAHFAARHKGMDAGAVLFASLCGALYCGQVTGICRWPASSGRGEIPHRRYGLLQAEPASAPAWPGVSRSGETPEPTVRVRMKEDDDISEPACAGPLSADAACAWLPPVHCRAAACAMRLCLLSLKPETCCST
jgi:hypothetical protein